jgi:hypothetical protein
MMAENFAAQFTIDLMEKDFGYMVGVTPVAPTIMAARSVFQYAIKRGAGAGQYDQRGDVAGVEIEILEKFHGPTPCELCTRGSVAQRQSVAYPRAAWPPCVCPSHCYRFDLHQSFCAVCSVD